MTFTPNPPSALQDILFHELHHRFYNSLQLVSSAIGILATEQHGPEDIRLLRDRIATLGGLHRALAKPVGDLDEMRDVFSSMCADLTRGFACGSVTLDLRAMSFPNDPMVVRGLALILVELVTNALKYGANDDASIHVVIDSDMRSFRLSVANAKDALAQFDPRPPFVAKRFAEALGGTLTIVSAPTHLVRVIVPIPGATPGNFGETA